MLLAATIDELTEVLVVSYKNASLTCGPAENILIIRLKHRLGHCEHIVPHAAQVLYDRDARRLINDEPHAG